MRSGPIAWCAACQRNVSTKVDGDGNQWCSVCTAAICCDDCGEHYGLGHECLRCPDCGSVNIETNDPRPGEHTCRDCGGWIEED